MEPVDQMCVEEAPTEERGKGGKLLAWKNFPTLMKDMNVNILQTQQTPNKANTETNMKIRYNETV